MELAVKKALGTKRFEPIAGSVGGGCISSGSSYHTDAGQVFVKINSQPEAAEMFEGELRSLQEIQSTQTVRVPNPVKVVTAPGSASLVMEHLPNLRSLRTSKQEEVLGEQLARLHLHNWTQKLGIGSESDNGSAITQYGFQVPTCCGSIPMNNSWADDWQVFYLKQRLEPQVNRLLTDGGDRDLLTLWPECSCKIEVILERVKTIRPSLLHGDLWRGNVGICGDGEPVIYDPASFYGHSEFDLGIGYMFGGFGKSFYDSYHKVILKGEGFEERARIYELFHHLNHWNHFGTSYKGSTIRLMKEICTK